jgi:hypothetical protein
VGGKGGEKENGKREEKSARVLSRAAIECRDNACCVTVMRLMAFDGELKLTFPPPETNGTSLTSSVAAPSEPLVAPLAYYRAPQPPPVSPRPLHSFTPPAPLLPRFPRSPSSQGARLTSQVVEVSDVLGVRVPSLLVKLCCLVELPLLVVSGSLELEVVGLLLELFVGGHCR